MSKLYRARSLLYRRQILQVNVRWKALDEIYKIYMLLHRSDLNISEICRQNFFLAEGKCAAFSVIAEAQVTTSKANNGTVRFFLAKFAKNSLFLNSFR